jgi:hypothetical protein
MIRSKVNEIVDKVFDGHFITREEIVSLLGIDPHSMEVLGATKKEGKILYILF